MGRKITSAGTDIKLLDILNDLEIAEYIDYKIKHPIIIKQLNFSDTFRGFLGKMEELRVFFYDIENNKVVFRSPSQRYLKIYHGMVGKESTTNFLKQITGSDKRSFYSCDKELGTFSLFATGKEHKMFSSYLKKQEKVGLKFYEVEIVFFTVFDSSTNGNINFDGLIDNIRDTLVFENLIGSLGKIAIEIFKECTGKIENVHVTVGGSQTLILKNGQKSTISGETGDNSNNHLEKIAKSFKNLRVVPNYLINRQKDSGVKTQSTIKVSGDGASRALVDINFSANTPSVREKVNTSILVTLNKPEVVSITSGNLGRFSEPSSFLAHVFGKSSSRVLRSSTFIILRVKNKS